MPRKSLYNECGGGRLEARQLSRRRWLPQLPEYHVRRGSLSSELWNKCGPLRITLPIASPHNMHYVSPLAANHHFPCKSADCSNTP